MFWLQDCLEHLHAVKLPEDSLLVSLAGLTDDIKRQFTNKLCTPCMAEFKSLHQLVAASLAQTDADADMLQSDSYA